MKKETSRSLEKQKRNVFLRRLTICAAALAFLFIVRFLFQSQYSKTNLEDCYIGAIASDILDHGFRFSYYDYMHLPDENSTIVEGIAAVPFFALFGRNFLALRLLGFLSGALTMLIGIWIIAMTARGKDTEKEYSVGLAITIFVLLYVFAPPFFIFTSICAQGLHSEGALAATLIIALYAWRRRAESTLSIILLWGFSGFAIYWHETALFPFAFVVLFTAGGALAYRRINLRRVLAGGAAFAAGISPAVLISLVRHGGDVALVVRKFTPPGAESFAECIRILFGVGSGHNVFLVAVALAAFIYHFGWSVSVFMKKKPYNVESVFSTHSLILAYVAGFGAIQVFLDGGKMSDTYQYWLIFWFYLTATAASRIITRLADRRSKALIPCAALISLFVIFSMNWKSLGFDPGLINNLKSDTGHAVCWWRFGRAFQIMSGDKGAVEKCRIFGGDRTLQCISGIEHYEESAPENLTPVELDAYIFGIGYRLSELEHGKIEEVCSQFTGARRRICMTGALARSAENDYLGFKIINFKQSVPVALPCEMGSVPFEGYESLSLRQRVAPPGKFTELCNQNRIQPNCGFYQGVCARSPSDCDALNGSARNDCLKIYKLLN